jgi:hypothetical protein
MSAPAAAEPPFDLDLPALARCTEAEYCRAAAAAGHNEFWWYFNGAAPYRGYSRPFEADGRWWFRVKPGFAWPVDFFRTLDGSPRQVARRALLGWQWPVSPEQANSAVAMNVIHDLTSYGIGSVASAKRRAVRKGLKNLRIGPAAAGDPALAREACEVWNSHVARTGWNQPMDAGRFAASWAELANWPGTTVLAARGGDGLLCAWLIARCIDDVVYIDTIASHSDRREDRPNDAMIYLALTAASKAGLRRAHYSLQSSIASLEEFKQSLGFVAHRFAARLRLRWPVGPALRLLRPRIYRRLHGDPDWDQS